MTDRDGLFPGSRPLPSTRPGAYQRRQSAFLPTLLDRLFDNAPERRTETPDEYTATRKQMRAIVQRDLSYLLNTTSISDTLDKHRHAEVLSSTLNFGVSPLAGSYLSNRRWTEVEQMIRRAITDYEPRLLPDTVIVKPLLKDNMQGRYNVLLFEISALVYMEPYPVEFTVQSTMDVETGRLTMEDGSSISPPRRDTDEQSPEQTPEQETA